MQISCGLKHSAVIVYCPTLQINRLVCFGGNRFGQCGNGEHGAGKLKTTFDTNVHLQGKSVSLVECAGAHTIVKTFNNDVYSFGLNDKGQLGLGVVGNFASTPQKIKRFTSFPITKISCSEESSSVVTSNGDLFVWGRNTEGMFDSEAGMFALDQPLERPTLIKGLKVERLSLGPKALVLQKPNSGCISIHGGLLPVATAQDLLKKSSFKSSYKEQGDAPQESQKENSNAASNQNQTQGEGGVDQPASQKHLRNLPYESLAEVSAFFHDKIVRDFVCGRGLVIVLAEDKPKVAPVELVNFQPEASEQSYELEDSESTIPEMREPTPEPSEEDVVVVEDTPVEEPPPQLPEPPEPMAASPSPRPKKTSKIKELIRLKRERPKPAPKPKVVVEQSPVKIESPQKALSPVVMRKADDHAERLKKMAEDRQKFEAEIEKKRLLREQRQKEHQEQKAKMQEEMMTTMQQNRHYLRQETVQLQMELDDIKNKNKRAVVESDSSPRASPKAPKMRRIGGGYVPPAAAQGANPSGLKGAKQSSMKQIPTYTQHVQQGKNERSKVS